MQGTLCLRCAHSLPTGSSMQTCPHARVHRCPLAHLAALHRLHMVLLCCVGVPDSQILPLNALAGHAWAAALLHTHMLLGDRPGSCMHAA